MVLDLTGSIPTHPRSLLAMDGTGSEAWESSLELSRTLVVR